MDMVVDGRNEGKHIYRGLSQNAYWISEACVGAAIGRPYTCFMHQYPFRDGPFVSSRRMRYLRFRLST